MARSTGLLAILFTLFVHLILFASPASAAPVNDEITVLAKRDEGTAHPANPEVEISEGFAHPAGEFEVDGELEDQHWKRGSYQSGWCGLHFTQYQKHQGPGNDTSKYRFDVIVKDSKGATIGETKAMVVGDHSRGGVYSALPKVLIVKPGSKDRDSVGFAYDGAHWDTGRHNRRHWCKVGRYDGGARQGDCGFTCN
ncbi:hypothetical protein AMS68_005732 [Peltaster fructicola]|uniref:Uncharacterized protein n=1 Tax=Peltaster fructicola TaxID=286661 RepID=A0A6H0XZX5_9PEZI|nr:hypothetical protein AMS68_005732 [Peltaster fructicola]